MKGTVLICLTPGIATGMAVLDARGELRASTVWGTHELKETLDSLVRALNISGYTVVAAVEALPSGSYGNLRPKLEAVRADIDWVLTDTYDVPIVTVAPREWKSSPEAKAAAIKSWRFDNTPMTTEQRDAFRIGRYVLTENAKTWAGHNH